MRGYSGLEHFVPAFPDEAVLTHLMALADMGSKRDPVFAGSHFCLSDLALAAVAIRCLWGGWIRGGR